MKVEQIYDQGLSHLSYAIVSEGKMAVIDPGRDSKKYYDLAAKHHATLVAVIETHPHADFVSCHLELMKQGAGIYVSRLFGARFPFIPFDDGDVLRIGKIKLKALNTPGHSPDSLSILLIDHDENEYAVFTGDTLFVNDVGRPDLRESSGNVQAKKEGLAKQLYHSLRDKLMPLPDQTIVYPAHGAGSLCGKALGAELSSTIGKEKWDNYALQSMTEIAFVKLLLEDQPFVPRYFPYDVELNRLGVDSMDESIERIKIMTSENEIAQNHVIIDTRPEIQFKSGHLEGAINLQNGPKFETWLGSIISPEEQFYLIAADHSQLREVIQKAAKIGYETNILGVLGQNQFQANKEDRLNLDEFSKNNTTFTIIDIRNRSEIRGGKLFEHALSIPLPELRERLTEIPSGKPIVVHCAGGYRSSAGASIIQGFLKDKVYDLGEDVNKFLSEKR